MQTALSVQVEHLAFLNCRMYCIILNWTQLNKYNIQESNSVMVISRITANTLAQLQKRVGPLPDPHSSMVRNKKQDTGRMISARPGTDAIMNMIKNLQEEIEVLKVISLYSLRI